MKTAVNIVINAAMVVIATYAIFKGVEWCSNLLTFWVWLNACAGTLIAICPEDTVTKMHRPGTPQRLSHLFDGAVVIQCAAGGLFLYAGLMIWSMVWTSYLYTKGKAPNANEPAN